MFKFKLKQTVFYLKNNRVHSAPITSRVIVDNAHVWCTTRDQKDSWQPEGPSREQYYTCHGRFAVDTIFETKEALVEALLR